MSRPVRDTMLHFLSDNLSHFGINVHPIRRDKDSSSTSVIQQNAVNVEFRNEDFDTHVTTQQIIIDVIHDNELIAEDMKRQVWDLLSARFFTPLYDYTVPASPVYQNTNVYWKSRAVRFRPVDNDFYTQLQCVLSVQYNLKSTYTMPS